MATFFVARIVDVTEQPVKAARPQASFDAGVTRVPLAAVKDAPGVFEIKLPDGVRKVLLTIPDQGDLWGVEQAVQVGTGDPPTVSADGATSINVRAFTVHTRGADNNVEVHVVMGQVRDCAAKLHAVADPAKIALTPGAAKIRRFGSPTLRSGAKGADVFDQRFETVTPPGKIFFLERPTAPKLVAVHHPDLPRPTKEPEKAPLPFHVFFHPSIVARPGGYSVKDYPFHTSYSSLISRYCVQPWDPATTGDTKSMIHQSHAGGGKAVFVFPVGSPTVQMGSLGSPAGLLRLLDEVSYWLQRTLGEAYPRQPVGPIAVSGFSAGITFLNAAIFGGTNARLQDQLLKHIFSLDGVFASSVPGQGEKMTRAFCNKVKAWHRKGADGRTFRAYTQSDLWFNQFSSYEKPTIVTAGEKLDTTRVADTASTTVLFMPARDTFWRPVEPWVDAWIKSGMQSPTYWFAHALIPSWFLEHGMTKATF